MNDVHDVRMNTADRHQRLQDGLIAAAERTIAASGLTALKARALAQEVGCALGAIYTVVPDLDALIFAVNSRTLDAIDAALRSSRGPSHPRGPARQLVVLSLAYLDYAAGHRNRWSALFAHTLPAGQTVPPSYRERQASLFRYVEDPLSALCPGLAAGDLSALARSLFSAVHGIVSLGVDGKISPVPIALLRDQVRILVEAIARGLAEHR